MTTKKDRKEQPTSNTADIPEQGETLRIHVFSQTYVLNCTLGLGTLPLISQFGGTELSKKQPVYMDSSCVSPMELLMSLNRRMSDCDKLIDPFSGNTSVLITGNAVQLAHIRSLTCSHNNKLTPSCLFFSLLNIFLTLANYNIYCSVAHSCYFCF